MNKIEEITQEVSSNIPKKHQKKGRVVRTLAWGKRR
jgi:hypothetical protein